MPVKRRRTSLEEKTGGVAGGVPDPGMVRAEVEPPTSSEIDIDGSVADGSEGTSRETKVDADSETSIHSGTLCECD